MANYSLAYNLTNLTNGDVSLTFTPSSGYELPNSITVSNGTLVSWSKSTGIAVISGYSSNTSVSVACSLSAYSVTYNVSHGSLYDVDTLEEPPATIVAGDVVRLGFDCDEGYFLAANSISVTNASYNVIVLGETDGGGAGILQLELYNATGNVTIAVNYRQKSGTINYSVTSNVSGATYDGPSTIYVDEITLYSLELDDSLYEVGVNTVTNATSNDEYFDESQTYYYMLSAPTGNVTINAECGYPVDLSVGTDADSGDAVSYSLVRSGSTIASDTITEDETETLYVQSGDELEVQAIEGTGTFIEWQVDGGSAAADDATSASATISGFDEACSVSAYFESEEEPEEEEEWDCEVDGHEYEDGYCIHCGEPEEEEPEE